MKTRSSVTLPALFTALLASAPAVAELPRFGTFVSAKAKERELPTYPYQARMSLREGWVITSFCIDANGNVRDPVIERSSGAKEFELRTLKVIPTWKYEPATLNGEPVEQCATRVRFSFSMQGMPLGARPQFVRGWKAAQKLIDAKDFAGADAKLVALKPENNYEFARVHFARARIAELRTDRREQYEEIQAALRFSDSVEKPLKADAKRAAFALATNLSLWADAVALYDELKTDYPQELSEPLKEMGEKIVGQVRGERPLGTDGKLTCRCDKESQQALWETSLLRREFGFRDVSGKVDRFELRCEGHRFSAAFTTEQTFRVPESWGDCRLYVFGDEGAKFRLVEMPDTATAQTPPASAPSEQS